MSNAYDPWAPSAEAVGGDTRLVLSMVTWFLGHQGGKLQIFRIFKPCCLVVAAVGLGLLCPLMAAE